jgi:hypothetical protein
MTVIVNRPAPAARRLWPVVVRSAGIAAAVLALGILLDRGSPAENGVDIGAGLLRIAVVGVAVAVGSALDGRRHGFRWAGQVWTAVVAVLSAVSVVRIVADVGTAGPALAWGTALGLLVGLGLPLAGLAVAGSAAGAALQGRAAADDNRSPTA